MDRDLESFSSGEIPEHVFIWRLEGHRAQRAGLALENCPYPKASVASLVWQDSWLDTTADHAFYEGAEYAQEGGLNPTRNPYAPEQLESVQWLEGFYEGLAIAGVKTWGRLFVAVSN